jgi:hypothetical protein
MRQTDLFTNKRKKILNVLKKKSIMIDFFFSTLRRLTRVACPSPAELLLYSHRQIHTRVDSAVELESAASRKGAKRATIVTIKGLVIAGRAALFGGFGRAVIPGAIGDNMGNRDIINQRDRLALADGDGGLDKVRAAHMDGWAAGAASVVDATGCQNSGQNREQCNSDEQLFIHEKNPFR